MRRSAAALAQASRRPTGYEGNTPKGAVAPSPHPIAALKSDRDIADWISKRTPQGLRQFPWHETSRQVGLLQTHYGGMFGLRSYTAAMWILTRPANVPTAVGQANWLMEEALKLNRGVPPRMVAYLFDIYHKARPQPAPEAYERAMVYFEAAEGCRGVGGEGSSRTEADAVPAAAMMFSEEDVVMILTALEPHRELFKRAMYRAMKVWQVTPTADMYALAIRVTSTSADTALAQYYRLRERHPSLARTTTVLHAVVDTCLEHRDVTAALDALSVASALGHAPASAWERLLGVSVQVSPTHVKNTYATMLAFGVTPSFNALLLCFEAYVAACTGRHCVHYVAAIAKARDIHALGQRHPPEKYMKLLARLFKKTGQTREDLARFMEANPTADEGSSWLAGWTHYADGAAAVADGSSVAHSERRGRSSGSPRPPRGAGFPPPINPPGVAAAGTSPRRALQNNAAAA